MSSLALDNRRRVTARASVLRLPRLVSHLPSPVEPRPSLTIAWRDQSSQMSPAAARRYLASATPPGASRTARPRWAATVAGLAPAVGTVQGDRAGDPRSAIQGRRRSDPAVEHRPHPRRAGRGRQHQIRQAQVVGQARRRRRLSLANEAGPHSTGAARLPERAALICITPPCSWARREANDATWRPIPSSPVAPPPSDQNAESRAQWTCFNSSSFTDPFWLVNASDCPWLFCCDTPLMR